MSEKPLIYYIDDEPHNLVVFEAACPDDWNVRVFETPAKALESLDEHKPNVIISDQRMPGMTGVQFLEISKKLYPDAVRIIVTGYSDEDLVVESVRKAQVFDYLKKPWEVDDLLASLQRALDFQKAQSEAKLFQEELKRRELELRETNASLTGALRDLELARVKETQMRQELQCWVPPFVLMALQDEMLLAGAERDVCGIAFDIINSGALHGALFSGRPIRSHVIQLFSEALMRHGGWRESHSGDSAYGHFGMATGTSAWGHPADSALAAAREFRTALKSLSDVSGHKIECGVALHFARGCKLHLHSVQLNTPQGSLTQKSFDTSSSDVDVLHRMEKLVHKLPGSNIVMSRQFADQLHAPPENVVPLGSHLFAGQKQAVELLVIASVYAKPSDIEALKATGVQGESISLNGPATAGDSAKAS